MRLVDSINDLVLGKLRGNRLSPLLDGDDIVVGGERLPLRNVVGIVAYDADIHAGTIPVLTLSFPGGQTVAVNHEDVTWMPIVAALDRLTLTSKPSAEWLTALIAGQSIDGALVLRG